MTGVGLADTYAGLRVLDLSTNLAGPLAAMVLADLGADVVKIERPRTGDDTRALPPHRNGESTVFMAVNRGKRSVTLDLATPGGRRALRTLARDADVVIESFGPGVAQRLGVEFSELTRENPRLVYASVSAFGEGPIGGGLPGYDGLVQAFAGIMSLNGHPGLPPARIGPSAVDVCTGLWVAIGIQAALARRDLVDGAQRVDAALVDAAFTLIGHQVLGHLATGESPERMGSAVAAAAPYEAFAALDGYVVVAVGNDRQWLRLCEELELDDLLADEGLRATSGRVARRAEVSDRVAERIAGETVETWTRRLAAARVPVAPVNDLAAAIAHPLALERELLVAPTGDARTDTLAQLRMPIDVAGECVGRAPPRLGEHTEEVLLRAGLSQAEIALASGDNRSGEEPLVAATSAAGAVLASARASEP